MTYSYWYVPFWLSSWWALVTRSARRRSPARSYTRSRGSSAPRRYCRLRHRTDTCSRRYRSSTLQRHCWRCWQQVVGRGALRSSCDAPAAVQWWSVACRCCRPRRPVGRRTHSAHAWRRDVNTNPFASLDTCICTSRCINKHFQLDKKQVAQQQLLPVIFRMTSSTRTCPRRGWWPCMRWWRIRLLSLSNTRLHLDSVQRNSFGRWGWYKTTEQKH